jgi:hypothetical protein
MIGHAQLSDDGRNLAVRVPMTASRRGGRKVIVAPEEAALPRSHAKVDNALVRALARAFHWRKLIEIGAYATIAELAAAEMVNPSYVSRLLRLTLLPPDIVEAILDGEQWERPTLAQLTRTLPTDWRRQQYA